MFDIKESGVARTGANYISFIFVVPAEFGDDLVDEGLAKRVKLKRGPVVEWLVSGVATSAPLAIQLLQGPQVLEYYISKLQRFAKRSDPVGEVTIHAKSPRGEIRIRAAEEVPVDKLLEAVRALLE